MTTPSTIEKIAERLKDDGYFQHVEDEGDDAPKWIVAFVVKELRDIPDAAYNVVGYQGPYQKFERDWEDAIDAIIAEYEAER